MREMSVHRQLTIKIQVMIEKERGGGLGGSVG